MTVAAMKAGAVNFIAKPFRDQDLLDAVDEALQRDRAQREAEAQSRQLRDHFDTLTRREQEVMQLAARGLMNKQIADDLGISEATVKIYRGHAMRKMQARTFAELVIMAQSLGWYRTTPDSPRVRSPTHSRRWPAHAPGTGATLSPETACRGIRWRPRQGRAVRHRPGHRRS
jgi:DNA-binding CsgD family transcriptional regulator